MSSFLCKLHIYAPLTSTLVRGCLVEISHTTIRRFLYGPTAGHFWSLNTTEFDYIWDIVRSGAFQRNAEQREDVILWLARYIAADGERAEWVAAPWLGIWKATLNFVAKFFWLLMRNRVSPTKDDNQVMWDRAVMVAALVAGLEIDFSRIEPQVEVLPLGADLADTVGQAQGDDLSIPDPTDTFSGTSSQAASMAPSSSRSTPQLGATVVPLARVQKLEDQMATLLHHIQPWMQKSIAKFEARMEHWMEGMMDRKVQAINKHLDAFELRVLDRSSPAIDLFTLLADLASLWTDVEAILATLSVEPQGRQEWHERLFEDWITQPAKRKDLWPGLIARGLAIQRQQDAYLLPGPFGPSCPPYFTPFWPRTRLSTFASNAGCDVAVWPFEPLISILWPMGQ
ncbi:hypothetical protein H5410_014907 [Solanum commersonii]|uniref:Putative plant transposon protein domain-containing protein n=1 Tax=Solanum commersonii TaxID=4109 RepID=A0A9J5ZSK9_SOLCO|nr:hypothetical protein H5410_014907 [Solanum commersonii]